MFQTAMYACTSFRNNQDQSGVFHQSMEDRRPARRIDNRLVTASATAILAVYSAGYLRTQSASEEFVRRMARRR